MDRQVDLAEAEALRVPLRPMLAVAGPLPDDGATWAYEMKWDGVRVVARVGTAQVRLTARSGNDVTVAYPELAELAGRLDAPAILDGEVVALGPDARPSFELLQRRVHISDAGRAARLARTVPAAYLAFDVCMLGGRWLLGERYDARRAALEAAGIAGDHVAVPAVLGLTGTPALEAARSSGLEGVVAKRVDSPYRCGIRSPSWVKHKLVASVEVVICGYMPGTGWRAGLFGALVLGVQGHDAGGREGLVYAGRVGTGFNEHALDELKSRLVPLRRSESPFVEPADEPLPGVQWVQPELVAEVSYQLWTSSGRLRGPSWRGLRPDLAPAALEPPPDRPSRSAERGATRRGRAR
ncbi:MAG TPA: non-homologous end-joining DNA ligase [Acidimicrobiales bacterium]|nr:non-homologous end-joining DNA ligase [Acidimicrobiales bacterium]